MKTVRVWFSKTGRAKYISHLDLNRAMIRALRRASIPLWYTEGFNCHPYVTFAAPLSLGYEGLRECMDFRLEEDMPMEELVSRLNAVMPEGLAVLSADEARMKPGDLAAARYRLTFGCLPEEVRGLLEQDAILVEKRTKKKTMKTVDIKPALSDIRLMEAADGCILETLLPCSSETTINPALIAAALQQVTGRETIRFQVTRLELYGKSGEVFS